MTTVANAEDFRAAAVQIKAEYDALLAHVEGLDRFRGSAFWDEKLTDFTEELQMSMSDLLYPVQMLELAAAWAAASERGVA